MSNVMQPNQTSVTSVSDLLDALNAAKVSEYGPKSWPFTIAQLRYFSDTKKNYLFYLHRYVPKKSGGCREISSPRWMLKMLQTAASKVLQEYYDAPKPVTGFVPGRSVADNASRHVRKNYVLNADLKDFFPSITRKRVKSALLHPPFSFDKESANLLSGICCAHMDLTRNGWDIFWKIKRLGWKSVPNPPNSVPLKAEDFKSEVPATLPQGAPSSPVLSNAVCIRLDQRLTGLAKRFQVSYSRYADDITFSSNHNVFLEGYSFMKEFRRIIADEGFTLNEEKLRLQRRGERQEVTGLIVNSKVNVCRKYVRSIGSLLHIWERYGVDTAYARFLKYNIDWRKTVNDCCIHDCVLFRPHLVETIQGRLAYIRMIRGEDDPVWSKLNDRFVELKKNYESRGVIGNPMRILHSWSIKRFEQLTGIKLCFGDHHFDVDYLHSHSVTDITRYFYIKKNGFKTYVHPSRYCKTRLVKVLEKGDLEEFERLKSEFRIGLCVLNTPWEPESLLGLVDSEDEEVLERHKSELLKKDPEQERALRLLHSYSKMGVYWKIFRRPPDIEDLPY